MELGLREPERQMRETVMSAHHLNAFDKRARGLMWWKERENRSRSYGGDRTYKSGKALIYQKLLPGRGEG